MVKPWYKSRTKTGAVIAGVGAILTTVGLVMQEQLDLATGITLIIAEGGAILTVTGIRNAMGNQ